MATKRLLAQFDIEDNQPLRVTARSRYIVNGANEWQMLFNIKSSITAPQKELKVAAQFDTNSFDKIRVIAYLYSKETGNVSALSSADFSIYLVKDITNPRWDEQLLTTSTSILQSNSYFFQEYNLTSLTGAELDGDSTLMIECRGKRLDKNYYNRIYVNHLGVYDSILRLRQDVDFLDIIKLDE